jgi:hypothetical protein
MTPIISFQFGHVYQRRAPAWVLASAIYQNPCYLWLSPIDECASRQVADPLLEGYVRYQYPAAFQIGLPDGAYRLTMTCYEPLQNHGPFDVKVGNDLALRNVKVTAGSVLRKTFDVQARNGAGLRFELAPAAGKDFIINGLCVEGLPGTALRPIFKDAPPARWPEREELDRQAEADVRSALRLVCDWLVSHRQPNGHLGVLTGWYTASMPMRALLAGCDIFGERRYLDAVLTNLDLFVSEQLPNGAFQANLRGKPTSALTRTELDRCLQDRLCMSDVGSLISTLAVASHYTSGPTKERYLKAVRHFCDGWAMQFQQPSGAFTDGQWFPDIRIYTCATAIQAAAFSLAHAVTGNEKYPRIAADAIRFLLAHVLDDGRVIGQGPHWPVHSGQPFPLEPLFFADLWYYDEGLITVSRHTSDKALRQELDEAIGRRVFGARGLIAALEGAPWWPIQDIWNNAKSLGMIQTLLFARARGRATPELETVLAGLIKLLCLPEYSRRVGVMLEPVELPGLDYSHTNFFHEGYRLSWAGLTMEATGFAGMTMAEIIRPGIIYLNG